MMFPISQAVSLQSAREVLIDAKGRPIRGRDWTDANCTTERKGSMHDGERVTACLKVKEAYIAPTLLRLNPLPLTRCTVPMPGRPGCVTAGLWITSSKTFSRRSDGPAR